MFFDFPSGGRGVSLAMRIYDFICDEIGEGGKVEEEMEGCMICARLE